MMEFAEQHFHEIEKLQEDCWNALTKAEQFAVFCAVSRRIHKAEMVDVGTYRHTLYDVFEFGPESYTQAEMSGYLEIHNAIRNSKKDYVLLSSFCKKNGIPLSKIEEWF